MNGMLVFTPRILKMTTHSSVTKIKGTGNPELRNLPIATSAYIDIKYIELWIEYHLIYLQI
jgi:hypothetical protein